MDKLLVILGAGPDQIPVYEQAAKLGVKTLAIDINHAAPAFAFADDFIVESTKNIPGLISKLQNYNTDERRISGVMTLGAEVSPSVAAVAAAFGLPGVSQEVAYLTTNKCARAEKFQLSGVNFPVFWSGDKFSDFSEVVYPVVIKPSDNSASRGVRLIENKQQLREYFETALSFSGDNRVILEEYIKGFEVSIEGVVISGQLYITGFADRNYSRNADFFPFFIEDGGDIPTRLSSDIVAKVKAEFEKAVRAVGINTGATKGDIIITPDGKVYVIEVTSRLSGGGFCSRTVPLTSGVNIVKTTIELALGLSADIKELSPVFQKAMCHRFYFHQAGKINQIVGMDKIAQMPGIADFVIQRPFKVGDILEPINYANRLFYVVAVANSPVQAQKFAIDALNSVSIVVE